MKKVFSFIIALIYLAVSSGIVVEIHHCMGTVAGASLGAAVTNNTCGKCGMDKGSNKCCKDEVKLVKLQDAQKLGNGALQITIPTVIIPHSDYNNTDPVIGLTAFNMPVVHAPPGHVTTSRCILHCVFRI